MRKKELRAYQNRKKFYQMPYEERYAYKKKLLKQVKIYSIATVVGVGLVFGSGALLFSNAFAKRKDMIEFEKANNIDYQGYVEQVKAEELEKLQESVLSKEISFEEYETAKENIETPSEMEYFQSLEPSVAEKYYKLDNKVEKALAYGFMGTILSAAPAITCAVLSDKKINKYRELR